MPGRVPGIDDSLTAQPVEGRDKPGQDRRFRPNRLGRWNRTRHDV